MPSIITWLQIVHHENVNPKHPKHKKRICFLRVVRKPSPPKNSFASKEPDLEIEDFDDSFASLQEAKLDKVSVESFKKSNGEGRG